MADQNLNHLPQNQQISTNNNNILIDLESDEDSCIQILEQSQIYQDRQKKNGDQKFSYTNQFTFAEKNVIKQKNGNQQNTFSNKAAIEIEDDVPVLSQQQKNNILVLSPIHKTVYIDDIQNQSNYHKQNNNYNNQKFGEQSLNQTQQYHNAKIYHQQKQIFIYIEDEDTTNQEQKGNITRIQEMITINSQHDLSNIHNGQKQISNENIICIEDEDKTYKEQKNNCIEIEKYLISNSQQELSNILSSVNILSPSNQYFYQQKFIQKQRVITDNLFPGEPFQNNKIAENNQYSFKEAIEINDDDDDNEKNKKQNNNIFQMQRKSNDYLNNILEQRYQNQQYDYYQQIQLNLFQPINVDEISQIDQLQNYNNLFDQNQILNQNNIQIEADNHFIQIEEDSNLGQQLNKFNLESSCNKQQNESGNCYFISSEQSIDKTLSITDLEEISDQSQMTEMIEEDFNSNLNDQQQLVNQIIIEQDLINTVQKNKFNQIDILSCSENQNDLFQENQNYNDKEKEQKEEQICNRNRNKKKQQPTQIEGPFQFDNFSWKINKMTQKRYLKKNNDKKQNESDFKQTASSNPKLNKEIGKQVHQGIEFYLNEGNKEELIKVLKDEKDAELIINQVETIKEYLKKRGMDHFYVEKEVSKDGLKKKIDYLTYNKQILECIIVDWKFCKTEQNKIFKQSECHFKQQIIATQNYLKIEFNCEFKVTLLVIPLKEIQNLKIIEYSLEDVNEIQKGLFKSKTFQKNKISYLKSDENFKKYQSMQCTLKRFEGLTLTQLAQNIFKYKEQKIDEFDYFNNLENAEQNFNYLEQTNLKTISQTDQFYLIHILIRKKINDLNNFFMQINSIQNNL
ncbi:hypothetical protein ABPG72_007117 [Tetrahymena utriculariae]